MKIAVALSGGVDSTAAVLALKRAGHDVFGITMRVCPDLSGIASRRPERLRPAPDGHGCLHCIAPCACQDAEAVARAAGIRHELVDLRPEFEAAVIAPFLDGFAAGRTPNPCATCNRELKFGRLADVARELGAEAYATGHYVRLSEDGAGPVLRRGVDPGRDQSYFLAQVPSGRFAGVRFPLGETAKPDNRRAVAAAGWHAREAVTSSEICFVKDLEYRDLMRSRRPAAFVPGEIVDTAGRKRGAHRGLPDYTIGQRRGLGVAAPEPQYVVRLEAETNRVVIGPDADLWRTGTRVERMNWLVPVPPAPLIVLAQVRYRQTPVPAVCRPRSDGGTDLEFERPVRALAPGQIAALYDGDRLLGGGVLA
jgi:tRNA-uridine 2-sulfurtransferase